MKKVLMCCVAMLASLVLMGQAFAFNAGNRVTIAPNGKGDLLYFPAYFTGGGWSTEFTLINTSGTDSVVAHIAVRRASDSAERDFLVFLSPTDVFNFKILLNAEGKPVVQTDDASMVIRNDCMTAADYAEANGKPYELDLGAGFETGYVEVIGVAQANLGVPPVAKTAICNSYRGIIGAILPAGPWGDANNVLAGVVEVYNSNTKMRGALRAFAFKDYDNTLAPNFGQTITIGQNAQNTQVEVDSVLCNDFSVVPYVGLPDGQTLFTATFPTRSGAYVGRVAEYTLYDLEEHVGAFSPPPSVNFIEMTTIVFPQETTWGEPVTRGWVSVDYQGSIGAGIAADGATPVSVVDGVPAIHTVMHTMFENDGQDIAGVGWFYAPVEMGNLLYAGVPQSHYAPVNAPATCPAGAQFCNY